MQSDKGNLRLAFSTRYNPVFDGKRKYEPLGMRDTPENRLKAEAIAYRIENDLLHPDWLQLFDPTFAKYGLKSQYAALKLAAPIPEVEPEMTVGAMWEDYLIWKQPQLQPTTFKAEYEVSFSNVVKGFVWNKVTAKYSDTDTGIYDLPLSKVSADMILDHPYAVLKKQNTLTALSEAFTRLQSQGKTKLTANPFVIIGGAVKNKTDKYKSTVNSDGDVKEWWQTDSTETDSEENDRRAFSKSDRDTIINAFYNHKNESPRELAPLVEFRFLTGCRSGEAFALHWGDCFRGKDSDKIIFRLSYSGRTKGTQVVKTGESRIFKMYPKLRDLLLRIKPVDAKPDDLVFTKLNGKSWDSSATQNLWNVKTCKRNGIDCNYPGIVTQLATDGLIDGYLPFYNCRHTFISLQAHAGTDLLLLATACGNSVEVIQRHYLGIDTTVKMTDI